MCVSHPTPFFADIVHSSTSRIYIALNLRHRRAEANEYEEVERRKKDVSKKAEEGAVSHIFSIELIALPLEYSAWWACMHGRLESEWASLESGDVSAQLVSIHLQCCLLLMHKMNQTSQHKKMQSRSEPPQLTNSIYPPAWRPSSGEDAREAPQHAFCSCLVFLGVCMRKVRRAGESGWEEGKKSNTSSPGPLN